MLTNTFFSKTACWFCVLLIMLPVLISGCAVREDYFIGYIEDTSYADIKQYTWHVVVNKPFTTEQLQELAIKLVEDAKQQEEFHVLAIMFYDYEEYIGHGYTLGVANYAPEGDMGKAASVMAGDYDSMSFEWILFEKDWDTRLSAGELEIWVAWIEAFYEELTPDYIPNRGDIMAKTAEALNLELDEVDRIVNKQAMWSMQDLQKEGPFNHPGPGKNEVEEIVFSMFSAGKTESEDKETIISMLPEINWMAYDYVSGGRAFEFLQWLVVLELEEEQHITSVLKSTEGLDGAWAEQYSVLVGELFLRDMLKFIQCLCLLDDENVGLITHYVAYNCSYHDMESIIAETPCSGTIIQMLLLKISSE